MYFVYLREFSQKSSDFSSTETGSEMEFEHNLTRSNTDVIGIKMNR